MTEYYDKTCVLCNNEFKTKNDSYTCCYNCFKFYYRFGGIKNYQEFLEKFELDDCIESKDRYIQFVDNVKKYQDIRGDWRVENILDNPGDFLDKVKIGEKRNKKKKSN